MQVHPFYRHVIHLSLPIGGATRASLVDVGKNLPALQETRVRYLGREDPLEKEVTTHFSTLAWKIPWTEEPGGLHPVHGIARVTHDLATKPPIGEEYLYDVNLGHTPGEPANVKKGLASTFPYLFWDLGLALLLPLEVLCLFQVLSLPLVFLHDSFCSVVSHVRLFAIPCLQHARPLCLSPTPGVYSNSCPLNQRCHPTISSSVIPFSSLLQSFPASGSFQMSQLFASGGQSIGVSVPASVLPMNI